MSPDIYVDVKTGCFSSKAFQVTSSVPQADSDESFTHEDCDSSASSAAFFEVRCVL